MWVAPWAGAYAQPCTEVAEALSMNPSAVGAVGVSSKIVPSLKVPPLNVLPISEPEDVISSPPDGCRPTAWLGKDARLSTMPERAGTTYAVPPEFGPPEAV